MRHPFLPSFFRFLVSGLLLGGSVSLRAAVPVLTGTTDMDIYYNAENPTEQQFAYRIQASGATRYEASGLPADATVDATTGWIVGNRNSPGAYEVTLRAANEEGVATALLHLRIHPAVLGVTSTRGSFHAGQTFELTLHYNSAVIVTGAPRLSLLVGPAGEAVAREAIYATGNGTTDLVFRYAVTASDVDPDGVQLLATAPFGGAIVGPGELSVSPTLPVRYFVSGIILEDAGLAVTNSPSDARDAQSLLNVSARMRIVEGDSSRSLIAGFVITGTVSKRVLLRAVGPALTVFGVSDALADPRLRLYSSTGQLVATNDDWAGTETESATASVGAFALPSGARDSAVVATLAPGSYTLVVAPNGGDGIALAEVYDADSRATTAASAVTNLSARGHVDGEESPLIAGFTISGEGMHRVLVRGIGPALAKFGVTGALADPALAVYRNGELIARNDNWTTAGASLTAAQTSTGAFALNAESKDAALVLNLSAGSYTAIVSGVGETTGAGLIEVYEVADRD